MYYYGYNNTMGMNTMPCNNGFVGYTNGTGTGAALWIVLFILLVIIIGAGWTYRND